MTDKSIGITGCSLCSRPFLNPDGTGLMDPSEKRFDENTWNISFSTINSVTGVHPTSRFYFHRDCYEKGKEQLITQLAYRSWPGGACFNFDERDRDGRVVYSQFWQLTMKQQEKSLEPLFKWITRIGLTIVLSIAAITIIWIGRALMQAYWP